MATGDIRGNIAQLQRLLRHIKYPDATDEVGLRLGEPLAVLPLLSYVLLRYSRYVAAHILKLGYQLQGKTDQRFVAAAFKLIREDMGVHCVLTPAQFLAQGFAERKVLLLCDVITACRDMHAAAAKAERQAAAQAAIKSPAKSPAKGNPPHVEVQWHSQVSTPHLVQLEALTATDAAQNLYTTSPAKSDVDVLAAWAQHSPQQLQQRHRRQGSSGRSQEPQHQQQQQQQPALDVWLAQGQQQGSAPPHHAVQVPLPEALQEELATDVAVHQHLQQQQQQQGAAFRNPAAHLPQPVVQRHTQQQQQQQGPAQQQPHHLPVPPARPGGPTPGAAAGLHHTMAVSAAAAGHQPAMQHSAAAGGPAAAQQQMVAGGTGGSTHQLEMLVVQLQAALVNQQQQFEAYRQEAARAQDALAARLTLLEGQLRFMNNRLEGAGGGGTTEGSRAPGGPGSTAGAAGARAAGKSSSSSIAGWLLQQQRAGALLGSTKSPWRGVRWLEPSTTSTTPARDLPGLLSTRGTPATTTAAAAGRTFGSAAAGSASSTAGHSWAAAALFQGPGDRRHAAGAQPSWAAGGQQGPAGGHSRPEHPAPAATAAAGGPPSSASSEDEDVQGMYASVHAARLAAHTADAALRRSLDALSPGASPGSSPGRGWEGPGGLRQGQGQGSSPRASSLARAAALVRETEALAEGRVPGPPAAAEGGGSSPLVRQHGAGGGGLAAGGQLGIGGWVRGISGSNRYSSATQLAGSSRGEVLGATAAGGGGWQGGSERGVLQQLSTAELINSLADRQGAAQGLLRDLKAGALVQGW